MFNTGLNPQTPLLHRVVTSDHVLSLDGGNSIKLKKGDRICVDLRKTLPGVGVYIYILLVIMEVNSREQECDINPERETALLHGAGFHKCIGIAFSEKVCTGLEDVLLGVLTVIWTCRLCPR